MVFGGGSSGGGGGGPGGVCNVGFNNEGSLTKSPRKRHCKFSRPPPDALNCGAVFYSRFSGFFCNKFRFRHVHCEGGKKSYPRWMVWQNNRWGCCCCFAERIVLYRERGDQGSPAKPKPNGPVPVASSAGRRNRMARQEVAVVVVAVHMMDATTAAVLDAVDAGSDGGGKKCSRYAMTTNHYHGAMAKCAAADGGIN